MASTNLSIQQRKFTVHHIIVFVVTFVSYVLYHANRKTFSNLKSSMINAWIPTNESDDTLNYDNDIWNSHRMFESKDQAERFAGVLDAVFMFSYAAGLYISGSLGDRFDPRIVLTIGMTSAALINFTFGCITEWFQFYSAAFFIFLWILNGLAQSTGWPPTVAVMGNWYGRGSRGLVLGIWSSSASVGNIVGSYLCALFLPYGYEYAFLVNSNLFLAGAVMVWFSLVRAPRDIGLQDASEGENLETIEEKDVENLINKRKPINFIRAVLIPGVILYSVAYAGLKLVNYAIFFWLPYYLTANFEWPETESDTVSTYYDWGGILGSIVGGAASDIIGKRSPVVFVQLIFSIVFLGVYTLSPNNKLINGLIMAIAGFFVNGAVNLISAAVAADLGRQEAVKHSAEALSTVSGIVEGTGSAAAAVGQVVVPVLEECLGWDSIFYMFMILLALSTIILSRMAYRESKEVLMSLKIRLHQLSTGMGNRTAIIYMDDLTEDITELKIAL